MPGNPIFQTDQIVYLCCQNKLCEYSLQLIKAKITNSGEAIWFLSNIMEMSANQLTTIYIKRWDIEVFFKFLKQELDLGHVLVRTENGLLVSIYARLIAAILLTAYQ